MEEEKIKVEDDDKPRKTTLHLNELKDNEKRFRELIERGQLGEADKFLKMHQDIDINSEDFKGLTALHYAVKKEQESTVKYLLSLPEIELNDVVLHAVATGNIIITKIILDTLTKKDEHEQRTYENSSEFSTNINPLLLAAQCGNFNMIHMLFKRAHRIVKPHPPRCSCQACKVAMVQSASSMSLKRLNYIRGVSQPAYICQASLDPILSAFRVNKKIQEYAEADTEFTTDYLELSQDAHTFVMEFISGVRNANEMEVILKYSTGYTSENCNLFPRLQLAIDYHQKEFVADPLVQQVLNSHWLGSSLYWHRMPLLKKCGRILLRAFTNPFVALIVIFAPNTSIGKKYHDPVNKFASHLASYLTFVTMIYTVCIIRERKLRTEEGKHNSGLIRTGLEIPIIFFVFGFILSTIKQLYTEGLKRYFIVPWHWYDLTMQLLFVITFFLLNKSVKDERKEKAMHNGKVRERKYWESGNSTLLYEGFFTVCCIMSFGRLGYFCLQSSRLGPIQISLGKMGIKIFYFLMIWFLLISGLAIPITTLYVYYDGMKQTDGKGQSTYMLNSFTSYGNAFGTLFWAMFALSPRESINIIIDNIGGDKRNPVYNYHTFTESVGNFLFCAYHILVPIALLNTLIAVLSNTFQKVVDNADVEWKFNRTKLWLFFFNEASPLPSPFNILLTFNTLRSFKNFFAALCGFVPGAKAKLSLKRFIYIEHEKKDTKAEDEEHEKLMAHLVQRYIRSKEHAEEKEKEKEKNG